MVASSWFNVVRGGTKELGGVVPSVSLAFILEFEEKGLNVIDNGGLSCDGDSEGGMLAKGEAEVGSVSAECVVDTGNATAGKNREAGWVS